MKEDFDKLVNKLQAERDELKLKMHLGSMEAKAEFAEAEKKLHEVKIKASKIADDAVDTSEVYIEKARVVGEELKEAYLRISQRLKK